MNSEREQHLYKVILAIVSVMFSSTVFAADASDMFATRCLIDGVDAAVLLLSPTRGHAFVERGVHPAIELVHVHGVQPSLEASVLRL